MNKGQFIHLQKFLEREMRTLHAELEAQLLHEARALGFGVDGVSVHDKTTFSYYISGLGYVMTVHPYQLYVDNKTGNRCVSAKYFDERATHIIDNLHPHLMKRWAFLYEGLLSNRCDLTLEQLAALLRQCDRGLLRLPMNK